MRIAGYTNISKRSHFAVTLNRRINYKEKLVDVTRGQTRAFAAQQKKQNL
jgi:hypothetical protein